MKIPTDVWTRRFNTPDPPKNVHSVVRPPVREILTLLPTAVRVGTYIHHERSHGREPIFDLTGITLAPPNPGPTAGVSCGGIGSGCIGRGYKGDFRRWSLHPGRYIHRVVPVDQFSIRVRYKNGTVRTQVLSTLGSSGSDMPTIPPELSSWAWSLPSDKAVAYALYPRSWTVYEDPVPGVRVIVKQVSPFLPESYSEASLPTTAFEVYVENTLSGSTASSGTSLKESEEEEVMEVSVMFTFQNGDGGVEDSIGGLLHSTFDIDTSSSCEDKADPHHAEGDDTDTNAPLGFIRGVVMNHYHQSVDGSASLPGSFAIACAEGLSSSNSIDTNTNSTSSGGCVTTCPMFIAEGKAANSSHGATTATTTTTTAASIVTAEQLWTSFRVTGDVSSVYPPSRNPVHAVSANLSPETRNMNNAGGDAPCHGSTMPQDEAQGVPHNRTTATTSPVIATTASTGIASLKEGISQTGTKVAAAVCHRQSIRPGASNARVFQFQLAWDNPIVQFGPKTSGTGSRASINKAANSGGKASSKSLTPQSPRPPLSAKVPRYYSRFFGSQGCAAWAIAMYGLVYSRHWEQRIERWQSTAIAAAAQVV